MTQPVDTVFVEVVPDLDQFSSGIERGVDAAARQLVNEIQNALRRAAQEAERAGDEIGRGIEDGTEGAERVFDELAREADDAADTMAREFSQGGERAEDALDEVGDKGEREFDRIEREANDVLGRIGGGFGRLAGIAAGAFAAIGGAQFIGNAVNQAADLGESINAINVVLGDGADSFLEFGSTAADQLGITQAALNQAIVPTASILLNAGSAGEVLSGQLQDIATRATDVASVFNVDTNTALEAFGAGLRGETEPLRQFGVNLNQAVIDAKAVELGLAASTSEVDQAARTQATFALIMEQTSVAAGDFVNNANSLPNLMRRFQATLDETSASLGTALIPALTEVASAALPVIESLAPAFEALGAGIAEALIALQPAIEVLVGALTEGLTALIPALAPVGEAIGAIVTAFAPLLPVIGELIGTLIPPLADIITLLADAIAPLIELVAEFASNLISRLAPVFDQLMPIIEEIVGVLGDALAAILPVIIDLFFAIIDATTPLIPVMLDLIRAVLPLLDPLLQLATAILTPLIELFGALFKPLIALLNPLIAIATIVIDALVSGALTPLIELLTALLVPILNVLAEVLLAVVVPPLELLTGLLEGDVTSAFENVGGVLGFFRNVATTVFNFFRRLVEDRIRDVIKAANRIREFVSRVRDFFNQAVSAVRSRINRVVDLVRGLPNRIRSAIGNALNILRQAGRNIIQGLINGINSMLGRIRDTISNVASEIRDFLPFSPARVGPLSGRGSPDLAGEAIGRMIALGIARQTPLVARATGTFLSGLRATEVTARAEPVVQQQTGVRVRSSAPEIPRIVLEVRGDDSAATEALLLLLRKAVRVRGGDVQVVLGQNRRQGR